VARATATQAHLIELPQAHVMPRHQWYRPSDERLPLCHRQWFTAAVTEAQHRATLTCTRAASSSRRRPVSAWHNRQAVHTDTLSQTVSGACYGE